MINKTPVTNLKSNKSNRTTTPKINIISPITNGKKSLQASFSKLDIVKNEETLRRSLGKVQFR